MNNQQYHCYGDTATTTRTEYTSLGSAQWIPFPTKTHWASTISPSEPMMKNRFAVIAAHSGSIDKVCDTLAEAKAYAKQRAHQTQTEFLVLKAVFATAPKVEVTEEDL